MQQSQNCRLKYRKRLLLHIFNDSNIVTVSIRKVNYNGAVLLIQSHSITFHTAFFVSVSPSRDF